MANPLEKAEQSKAALPTTVIAGIVLVIVGATLTRVAGDVMINIVLFGLGLAYGKWSK